VLDKLTRKASLGKYRVIDYDQYDYSDYFINEYSNIYLAIFFGGGALNLAASPHPSLMFIIFIIMKKRLYTKEPLTVALKSCRSKLKNNERSPQFKVVMRFVLKRNTLLISLERY